MRGLSWLALLCVTGCYLHHGRELDRDATTDAALDAAVDASADALVDAPIDAAADVPTDAPLCEIITLRPEPITAPVDIVWAIDSSMSMQDERERLQATINDFARRVSQRVTDLRVVVITAENIVPPPLGTDAARYLFVPQMIASNDVLSVLIDNADTYLPFLRDNALLHFVAVSDDDSALSADAFKASADARFNKPYTVHAIASPNINGGPCRSEVPSPLCVQTGIQAICGAAAVGVEYYRAAELTNGLSIDVCLDDWSRVIGPLSDAVVGAEPVPCRSTLVTRSVTPPNNVRASLRVGGREAQSLAEVTAEFECGNVLGFYREPAVWPPFDNFVLCPRACEEAERTGGEIEIALDCPF